MGVHADAHDPSGPSGHLPSIAEEEERHYGGDYSRLQWRAPSKDPNKDSPVEPRRPVPYIPPWPTVC